MVKSLLDSSINYPEIKVLENADKDYPASMYDVSLLDTEVVIALGQPKYTYVERNIIYYPIYLVKNNSVDSQIGLYEANNSNLSSLLDDDGDINLGLLNDPLLYSFVNKNLLNTIEVITIEDDEVKNDEIKLKLTEQTAADAQEERTEFDKKDKSVSWIQHFMKNVNYGIVENEGNGECLFAVIRDGLKTIDKEMSVAEMRKILADNATQEMLDIYRKLYDDAAQEDNQLKNELKVLMTRNKELKEKMKLTKNQAASSTILAQAEEVQKTHKQTKNSKAYTEGILREFAFMNGVTNLNKLKAKIQTCSFWGNTWAISTLERSLNIKLIIVSEEYYKEGDLDNVLQCGQLNDDIDEFTPTHYVIVNHQGHHYQLITYKEYGAFTFQELPYDIKMLVATKCMERLAGPYFIIPDFREWNEKINNFIDENEEQEASVPATLATSLAASLATAANAELQSDLYANSTVFQFYSGSTDKPAPGSGAGETLGPEGVKEYDDLKRIPGWRKMLSNVWPAVFMLDGHKWLSVEHYYQGSKFKRGNKDYYLQFSLDSNTELSKNQGMAEGAGHKNGKYQGKVIRPKEVTIDADFFSGRDKKEMEDAMFAKFSQNADLKKILLATKKAKLLHFVKGYPPVVFNELMRVRQRLL